MSTIPPHTTQGSVGHVLDEAPTSLFHLKTAFTSGMGFLTDAYDLNVISTALLLIKPQFHLSAGQVGLVGSTALIASFVGAFVFGRIADVVGRKRVYGIEALVMAIGAILTALSPNFAWLLVTRFILGIGIGGDYPVSATIMTEYASRRSRGRQVAIMFSSYTFGQITALIIAMTLLAAGVNGNLAWRLMLGLGAIPALAVLYNRRRMPESPRYTEAVIRDSARAARELNEFADGAVAATASDATFGPNAGTMVFAAESFPVSVRSTGHGLSAGIAKLGAYIGALYSPILLANIGLPHTELIAALFYLGGIVFTLLIPEPAGRSLDDLAARTVPAPRAEAAAATAVPGP